MLIVSANDLRHEFLGPTDAEDRRKRKGFKCLWGWRMRGFKQWWRVTSALMDRYEWNKGMRCDSHTTLYKLRINQQSFEWSAAFSWRQNILSAPRIEAADEQGLGESGQFAPGYGFSMKSDSWGNTQHAAWILLATTAWHFIMFHVNLLGLLIAC